MSTPSPTPDTRIAEGRKSMNAPISAPVQMPNNTITRDEKSFRIPWRIHVMVTSKYNALGYDQSAEQLARRGGFSLDEIILILAGENPYKGKYEPLEWRLP